MDLSDSAIIDQLIMAGYSSLVAFIAAAALSVRMYRRGQGDEMYVIIVLAFLGLSNFSFALAAGLNGQTLISVCGCLIAIACFVPAILMVVGDSKRGMQQQ